MRYAKFVVRHFKNHIQYYSLWNEEDITYWNPYPMHGTMAVCWASL